MSQPFPVQPAPGALPPPAFDSRLNNLVLTFVVTDVGGALTSYDAALDVVNGEGQVWLEPPDLPVIGEITTGRLIIASESFPAYAPMTLRLRGLELRLLAQGSHLMAGGFYAQGRSVLRLQCAGAYHPSLVYSLHWPSERRLLVRRWDLWGPNAHRYDLELEVVEGHGQILSDRPRTGTIEGGFEGRVNYNRICLLPLDNELTLRLYAARWVLDFHEGQVRLIQAFSTAGFVAAFALRDTRRFGSSLSIGFRDVIN